MTLSREILDVHQRRSPENHELQFMIVVSAASEAAAERWYSNVCNGDHPGVAWTAGPIKMGD